MSNSYKSERQLDANGNGKTYHFHCVKAAEAGGLKDANRLPFSLKILLENILRHEDGDVVVKADIDAFGDSVTTDHISPAGSIKADSPAGHYLKALSASIAPTK